MIASTEKKTKPSTATITLVNQEIDDLTKLRTTGMSHFDFLKEMGRYVAQATMDKEELMSVGMPEELFVKCDAYVVMLFEANAKRDVAEGKSSTAYDELIAGEPEMDLMRDILLITLEYIILFGDDSEVKAAFKNCKKGKGRVGRLQNNLSFLTLIEPHLELLQGFTPAGQVIDQTYLDSCSQKLHHTIDLVAEHNASETVRGKAVQRLKKLSSLCLDAIDEIKLYAKAAFLQDKEYYKEKYVNQVHRKSYRKSLKDN